MSPALPRGGPAQARITGTASMDEGWLHPPRLGGGDEDDGGDADVGRPGTGVATQVKPRTKKPSMYKVLMLNDDYTPMEFVV